MTTRQLFARRTKAAIAAALVLPAVALIASPSSPLTMDTRVTYIDGDRTRTAFAKGQPLVETATYKVHASRREAPGMAEIHTLDTDIIYVLDGAAIIVTGGQALQARETAPNEIRGASIEGGTEQRLTKGDLFIVPNGVPHWFKHVEGPFLYYVVKTTAIAPAGGIR